MAGAFICYRLKFLLQLCHRLDGLWQRRINARVVAGVEAVDRSLNSSQRLFVHLLFFHWRCAIENEGRLQLWIIGGVTKRLTAAPAVTGHGYFAVRGW